MNKEEFLKQLKQEQSVALANYHRASGAIAAIEKLIEDEKSNSNPDPKPKPAKK